MGVFQVGFFQVGDRVFGKGFVVRVWRVEDSTIEGCGPERIVVREEASNSLRNLDFVQDFKVAIHFEHTIIFYHPKGV